jgi:hypothetical protein
VGVPRGARPALDTRRARCSPPQADDGIAFHLLLDLVQIEPVRGSDAFRRNLTFANRPSDTIRTHANKGCEFFDRHI